MPDQSDQKSPASSAGGPNIPDVTSLPVLTHSEHWPMVCVGMGDSVKIRPKKAPDGRPTYSSGTILRTVNKDGEIKSDKTASVNVIEPAKNYELGQFYRASGKVWVQPWENNGRMALSITVEKLVPLK